MASIDLRCSNPQCAQPLSFDSGLQGSIQSCKHCGQRLILPETQELPYQEYAPERDDSIFQEQQPRVTQQFYRDDNRYQSRTQKKVKAGAGCLAMVAAFAGVFVVALGISIAGDFSTFSLGTIISLAGIAGIAAFAYFGYFAVEGDDDHRDHRRTKRRYD